MFQKFIISGAFIIASNAFAFDYTCTNPITHKSFTVTGNDMQITLRSSDMPTFEGNYPRLKLPAAARVAEYGGWNDHDDRVNLQLPKAALAGDTSRGFRAVLTTEGITSQETEQSAMFICIR